MDEKDESSYHPHSLILHTYLFRWVIINLRNNNNNNEKYH